MVDTHQEKIEMEEIKQKHKIELMEVSADLASKEHIQKMKRLNKMLDIAKAGGVKMSGA